MGGEREGERIRDRKREKEGREISFICWFIATKSLCYLRRGQNKARKSVQISQVGVRDPKYGSHHLLSRGVFISRKQD